MSALQTALQLIVAVDEVVRVVPDLSEVDIVGCFGMTMGLDVCAAGAVGTVLLHDCVGEGVCDRQEVRECGRGEDVRSCRLGGQSTRWRAVGGALYEGRPFWVAAGHHHIIMGGAVLRRGEWSLSMNLYVVRRRRPRVVDRCRHPGAAPGRQDMRRRGPCWAKSWVAALEKLISPILEP